MIWPRAAEGDSEDAEGVASRDVEEPEIDLKALDAANRSLTNDTFLMIGVWLIWRDMLAALQILDDVALWSYTKPGVVDLQYPDGH
jgi:potassium efflux system protein